MNYSTNSNLGYRLKTGKRKIEEPISERLDDAQRPGGGLGGAAERRGKMIDNNGRQKGFPVSASPKSVLCFLSCQTKKGRPPAGTGSLITKQSKIFGCCLKPIT